MLFRLSVIPAIFALLSGAPILHAQAPAPAGPDLAEARQFVRSLPTGSAADSVFTAVGRTRSSAMLMQVYSRGNLATASLDDWADQHLALTGLVEFLGSQTDPIALLNASGYASLQDTAYGNHEADYVHALGAAQESLALLQRSGLTQTIYVKWAGIARDLWKLGRTGEALEDFRKSRELIPAAETYSHSASGIWRDIVKAELSRGNTAAAADEAGRFVAAAGSAPPFFSGQAELARADLLIAQDQYGEVPDIVNRAFQAVLDPLERAIFGIDAYLELLGCVADSMNRLPYADAIALAGKIDKEVTGLPVKISGLAQSAARARRRMSGDLEGVLRDDFAVVEEARRAGKPHGQIEALRALAADFAASGSLSNQTTALEQAAELERMLLPPDGVPPGYPAAFSLATTFGDLASAYARIRPFGPVERDKSIRLLADALAAIDQQPAAADRTQLAGIRAEVQLERAEILALVNQPDEARKILQAALQEPVAARYDKSDVYLRLARLDRDHAPEAAAANYDLAIAEFRAARQLLPAVSAHVEAARALARTALYDKAQAHLDAAAKDMDHAGFADAEWKLPYISGIVFEGQRQASQAADAYRESVNRLDTSRAGVGEGERQSFTDSEWAADLYARLIGILTQLGRHQEAWQYTERAKARTFVESLQGRKFKDPAPPQSGGELADLERRMIALRLRIAPENDLLMGSSGESRDALKGQLLELENRFTLVREEQGLASSRASKAVSLDPPDLADIQAVLKQLDHAAVLLEYAVLPDGLTAFVIGPASFEQVTWKVDVPELGNDVSALRRLLQEPHPGEELNLRLQRVGQSIWQPVAGKLPAGTRRLVIAPASFLNYVPFQTLSYSSGRQLIDRFTISYLPSVSTLPWLGAAQPLGGDLFLGALGSLAVEGHDPLPGTNAEVDGIARAYPGSTIVREKELTHDAVLHALLDHQAVHLATHGAYDPDAPLFSMLLTSPAPGQMARVSMYELTQIQLKARLVVLSACESDLGKMTRGDEISGLTRTILSAGAKTVVSSLWSVDDDPTALLMREFYAQLRRGRSPSEAMRAAALVVRKKYPQPVYWAPFVVTGAF